MSDAIDRARDIIERYLPAMPDQQAAFVTRDAARALDAAGLLVTPKHDAEVASKALRIVESVCMTTDGDHLEGESEIPVGVVMRMILEAEEAFGVEREAGDMRTPEDGVENALGGIDYVSGRLHEEAGRIEREAGESGADT